jgi:hypothetical protein
MRYIVLDCFCPWVRIGCIACGRGRARIAVRWRCVPKQSCPMHNRNSASAFLFGQSGILAICTCIFWCKFIYLSTQYPPIWASSIHLFEHPVSTYLSTQYPPIWARSIHLFEHPVSTYLSTQYSPIWAGSIHLFEPAVSTYFLLRNT